MVIVGTSGAAPVGMPLLLPLEQAARAAMGMAATRQYLSLLMSRNGFSPHYGMRVINPDAPMRPFAANYTNLDLARLSATAAPGRRWAERPAASRLSLWLTPTSRLR